MKKCRLDGCDKPVKHGRTVCCMHENRFYRTGSFDGVKILPKNSTKEQIIEKYLSSNPTDSGCIETKSALTEYGYGRVHYQGKGYFAHRFIYEYYNGEIPKGMIICHKCDNPKCVNIKHLFIGTHDDNVQDKIKKGRSRILQGSECGRAKLNEDDVIRIRNDNRKYKEIAIEYKVSLITIKQIRARKTWKHI